MSKYIISVRIDENLLNKSSRYIELDDWDRKSPLFYKKIMYRDYVTQNALNATFFNSEREARMQIPWMDLKLPVISFQIIQIKLFAVPISYEKEIMANK